MGGSERTCRTGEGRSSAGRLRSGEQCWYRPSTDVIFGLSGNYCATALMRECAKRISKECDRVPFHWRNEQSEQVLMGIFLDSAYKVLARERRPLSVQEITEIALQEHFLSTDGATPWQTMKAKLSVDILQHRERSLFMRSDRAKFALREWSHAY